MDNLNLEKVQMELSQLLNSNQDTIYVFKYLSDRKRATPITDLSQMLTNMRKSYAQNFNKSEILEALTAMVKIGLCIIRGPEGREKIYWNYWMFPIFDSNNKRLLGIELKTPKALLDDRTLSRKVKNQIEVYQTNLMSSQPDNTKLPDIVFDQKANLQMNTIEQYTTEQILLELERRGLKLQLNTTKNS